MLEERKTMKHKGIRHDKYWARTCGTCKRRGDFRICLKHGVHAPDKQCACNDHKFR